MNDDLLNVFGSFSEISLDCIEKQNEEIKQLEQENQQLHNKIDKAIDLIEKSVTSDVGFNSKGQIVKYHQLTEDETGELLEILKDSDLDAN